MCIASKEARETKYWVELLIRTEYLNKDDTHVKSLLEDMYLVFIRVIKNG